MKRTRLRTRSPQRARQIRQFIPQAEAFLAEYPWCQHPTNHTDRPEPAVCVHHQRGRRGRRLLDPAWWASSCAPCNDEAETDTGRSLAVGWLYRIEGT